MFLPRVCLCSPSGLVTSRRYKVGKRRQRPVEVEAVIGWLEVHRGLSTAPASQSVHILDYEADRGLQALKVLRKRIYPAAACPTLFLIKLIRCCNSCNSVWWEVVGAPLLHVPVICSKNGCLLLILLMSAGTCQANQRSCFVFLHCGSWFFWTEAQARSAFWASCERADLAKWPAVAGFGSSGAQRFWYLC